MSEESHDRLIAAICVFIDTSESRKRPLVEWKHILGWINWGLNMFPLLRPAMQSSYMKISRKHIAWGMIYLYKAVIWHFTWLTDMIEASDHIHLLEMIEWTESDAKLIIYCDASLSGLRFFASLLRLGFYAVIPENPPLQMIFYFEALCICTAILWALGFEHPVCQLLAFTDSLNCIEMFNSLSAKEGYNKILLFVMRILIASNISLHVFQVPGTDNVVTDVLSRNLPKVAAASIAGLQIHIFKPPRSAMGQVE